jgi:hypothetical protein
MSKYRDQASIQQGIIDKQDVELKRLRGNVTDLLRSRDIWRKRAEGLAARVTELERTIDRMDHGDGQHGTADIRD